MKKYLFSTQSFGPGHLIGASILTFGTVAIARGLIKRHQAEVQGLVARGQYK